MKLRVNIRGCLAVLAVLAVCVHSALPCSENGLACGTTEISTPSDLFSLDIRKGAVEGTDDLTAVYGSSGVEHIGLTKYLITIEDITLDGLMLCVRTSSKKITVIVVQSDDIIMIYEFTKIRQESDPDCVCFPEIRGITMIEKLRIKFSGNPGSFYVKELIFRGCTEPTTTTTSPPPLSTQPSPANSTERPPPVSTLLPPVNSTERPPPVSTLPPSVNSTELPPPVSTLPPPANSSEGTSPLSTPPTTDQLTSASTTLEPCTNIYGWSKYEEDAARDGGSIPEPTIIDGWLARDNEFPWQAVLQGGFLCGGSIISDRHILTAAHCVFNRDATTITVIIGNIANPVDRIFKTVLEVIIHPLFPFCSTMDDIAILLLSTNISSWSDSVRPIGLGTAASATRAGDNVTVSGHGRTNTDVVTIPLRYGNTPLLPLPACQACLSPCDGEVCTGSCDGNSHSMHCLGDSGGPLVWRKDRCTFELVGVVSWVILGGEKHCNNQKPGVFADVFYYRTWIQDVLNNN